MANGQGQGQQRGDGSPPGSRGPTPGGGVDPMSLATLIGVAAVLVIAFASWRDVDRIGERLDKLEARMNETGGRVPAVAPQRGPDPNRVYTVRIDGAPIRGKAGAPVTIVEFSDFQ